MKIEIGKKYMCGDICLMAIYSHGVDLEKEIVCVSENRGTLWTKYLGHFNDLGKPSCFNEEPLRVVLTEIPSVKELTMKEVNEKFGYEVKIIEG